MSNITDTEMAQLNTIMVGFNETDLTNLTLNTASAVATLGTLTGWSINQVILFKNFKSRYLVHLQ